MVSRPNAWLLSQVLLLCARSVIGDGGSSCVQSIQGVMLCCALDDHACMKKQQEAHPTDDEAQEPLRAPDWYVGNSNTFARLPQWDNTQFDLCVVGVPYDISGDGTRSATVAVRAASKRIQPWHRGFQQSLQSRGLKVVDANDLLINPFDVRAAAREIQSGVESVLKMGRGCVILGGDHGVIYGTLKAAKERYGKFALVHLDAHLDSHGTPLRWAVAHKLFDPRHSIQVGIRGTTASEREDAIAAELGLELLPMSDVADFGTKGVVDRILKRLQRRDGTFMDAFVVLSMNALDPAYAPGVALPEVGGFTSREMQAILQGLQGSTTVLSAAIVGAATDTDPTKVTAMTVATLTNDLLHLMAKGGTGLQPPPLPAPEMSFRKEDL